MIAPLMMLRGLSAMLRLDDCDSVGRDVRVSGRPLVRNEGRIEIGDEVTIHSSASPVRLATTNAGTITIGERVTIEPGVAIFSDSEVRVHQDVIIGPNVTICDRGADGVSSAITIEAGVRIGAGARIVAGCVVPRGAVVPPGSTVPSEQRAPAKHAPFAAQTVRGAPTMTRVRAVLAADFTIDELAHKLADIDFDGLSIEAEVAPFDHVIPTLIGLGSRDSKVDLAFVWAPGDDHPAGDAGLVSHQLERQGA